MNTVVLIILSSVLGFYVVPVFWEISQQKVALWEQLETYNTLKEKGFLYADFIKAQTTFSNLKALNTYNSNIIKSIKKEEFESYFYNSAWGDYQTFMEEKTAEIWQKKAELEESWVWAVIQNILPYYSSSGSLSDTAMSDFSFINYIENLLYRFRLTSMDDIWVWEFSVVEEYNGVATSNKNTTKKQSTESPLDGKIYAWQIPLTLVGKKKNIIDFVHYIQNVGKIEMVEWMVWVKQGDNNDFIFVEDNRKEVNYFKDIQNYFRDIPEEKRLDYYNNLIMEFDSITFSEYPDSSDLPTPDGESFLSLIKTSQWGEEYSIDTVINFYIKWLPQYKISESIENMFENYTILESLTKELSQHIKKNQATLISKEELLAINSVLKIDKYISLIGDDIKKMKTQFAKKENLENMHWKSTWIQQWFGLLFDQLSKHTPVLSETIMERYAEQLSY